MINFKFSKTRGKAKKVEADQNNKAYMRQFKISNSNLEFNLIEERSPELRKLA